MEVTPLQTVKSILQVKISNMDLVTVMRKLYCFVKLKRIHLVPFNNKIVRLRRCRVQVNNREYREYISKYKAKIIAECLEKLVNESKLREQLILESKNKIVKTRSSFMFFPVKENDRPETPQENFLQNFNLMPKHLRSSSPTSNSSKDEKEIVSIDKNQVHRPSKLQQVKKKVEDDEDLFPIRPKMKLLDSKKETPKKEKKMRVNIRRLYLGPNSLRYFSPQKTSFQDLEECPGCPRTFVKAGHLRKHLRRVHKIKDNNDELMSDEEQEDIPYVNTEFICEQCNIPFSTAASLKKHEAFIHDMVAESLIKESTQCSECAKQFQCPASLKRHIMTEHRKVMTPCPRCGDLVSRLDNHMATVHDTQVLSPCPHCSVLLVPGHIARHIKTVHLGYKHRCVLCDRFISNIHKHLRSFHRVDHSEHQQCDCIVFLGPSGSNVN